MLHQIQSFSIINSFYLDKQNLNQIKLVIKGRGTQSIINPNFANKQNIIVYNNREIASSNSQLSLEFDINTIILKFSSVISTCNSMFLSCSKITEIDLTNFDSSRVNNIDYMFKGCTSLKSIKFGNFKTWRLDIMEYVFQNCESLKSLDLSSFDTSSVTDFHFMFSGCKSLKSLDLSNFRTSRCICTFYMFYDCASLTSINFGNFDTSQVTLMHYMFYNCKKLISLDLSSFDTSSLTNLEYMFYGCEKLEYINFKKARLSTAQIQVYSNMLTGIPNDIIFCVDNSKTPLLSTLMRDKQNSLKISDCSTICLYKRKFCCYSTCEDCETRGNNINHKCTQCRADYDFEIEINGYKNCFEKCDNLFYIDNYYNLNCVDDSNCPDEYNKLIMDKNQCVQNCTFDRQYIYEYKNFCYIMCPNGTIESNIIRYYCINICTKNLPFKLIEADECVEYCPINDIKINNCELYYKENETNFENKIAYCIQKDLTRGYDLSEVDSGNDVIIERNNSLYIITTTENQKIESNRPTISFGKCETNLKNYYNISLEAALYILKIEVYIKGMKIPKIEYELYYPINGINLTKLDLSICKNDKIEISIPVEIKDVLDKYNPQSDYYNDICYTITSESGTDISLSDRKDEFVDNDMTLCEEDCTFIKYDYIHNRSICNCDIKIKLPLISEIVIDKNKLYDSFTDINNIANIHILKCYKLLLGYKIIKNIGFYITTLTLVIFIICSILFCACDYKKLKNKIEKIVNAKNNYKISEKINNKQNMNKKKSNSNNKNKNKIFVTSKKNKTKNKSILKTQNNIKFKKTKIKRNVFIKSNKNIPQKNNQTKIKSLTFKNTKSNTPKSNNTQRNKLYQKILAPNDAELNNFDYKKALNFDKRAYSQYYFSLLKTSHLFIFSFILSTDYNSKILKIILFFFIVIINLTVNALFFNDSTMHVIYKEKGKFDIIYQIPQILYSSLISGILTSLLKYLSLTENTILTLKNEKNLFLLKKKKEKVLNNINKKIILFFILSFCFLLLFCYYISCFCAVYKNTQIHLIKDFSFSFGLSLIYPLFIYLLPGIFRIPSLKKKKSEYMYNFSKILQLL